MATGRSGSSCTVRRSPDFEASGTYRLSACRHCLVGLPSPVRLSARGTAPLLRLESRFAVIRTPVAGSQPRCINSAASSLLVSARPLPLGLTAYVAAPQIWSVSSAVSSLRGRSGRQVVAPQSVAISKVSIQRYANVSPAINRIAAHSTLLTTRVSRSIDIACGAAIANGTVDGRSVSRIVNAVGSSTGYVATRVEA